MALIWSCWSRYPGIRMDVDLEMPELHALSSYYVGQGGQLWVAEDAGTRVGMIATRPADDGAWEICRVYVDPARHGSGLGHELLTLAERHAIQAGAKSLVLFSDTRFDRAHRFYEKRSYVRHGPIRVLNDISNSLEYRYAKPVSGVRVLDIVAATSAARRLGHILATCAEAGDLIAPLDQENAANFYRRVAANVGTGRAVMVGAWHDGVLVGSGLLNHDTPSNQRHRTELQNVLVLPAARRAGIGGMILHALEEQGRACGRSLLTLGIPATPAAEALCRSRNFCEAGRIPGYAVDAGGTPVDTVFFWKRLV